MQNRVYTWPGWETVRPIGVGSFGKVYEIQRKVFNETEKAALKVISIPQNDSDIDEMYSDGYDEESITTSFQNHLKNIVSEYMLMRKMNGTANIVQCEDVRYTAHSDGIGWDIFIKMELLTPLPKALPSQISEETVIQVAKDICAALDLCSKHNIVHRDIKPQNIMMSPNGDYKLGDFGIAKTVEKTMGGTKIGTYKYMAPEVFNNQPYGSTADICSLGLVLYWMLNERRLPFQPLPPEKLRADMEHEECLRRFNGEQIPPPLHGSEQLKRIVLKACAFDPKDRYASAAQMLEALELLDAGAAPAAVPVRTIAAAPVSEPATKPEPAPKPAIQQQTSPKVMPAAPVTPPADSSGPAPERPAEVPKKAAKAPEPRKEQKPSGGAPSSAKRPVVIAAAVVGLLALVLMLAFCGKNAGDPTHTEPVETLPYQADFTDWMDELPEYVTAADYVIKDRTLYSTQTLMEKTSTESDTMEGWELYDTISNLGEYGPLSEWSKEKVTATDTRRVEEETYYRYKTKDTTTSNSSEKSGWTLYDTTYASGDYGSWSNWSTTKISESSNLDVQQDTQYRYRTRETTTSYSESLSGYTQTGSSWEKSGSGTIKYAPSMPGGFSKSHSLYKEYNNTPKSASESSTTKTKIDSDSTAGYLYYHWCRGSYSSGPINRQSKSSKQGEFTAFHAFFSTKAPSSLTGAGDGSYQYSKGSCCKDSYWYYATKVKKQTYTTYKKLFSYERWSDWSSWGFDEVSSTSSRKVETRPVWRSRSRTQTPVYHFYRWSDWSDWSTKEVSETSSRKVEKETYYRYQDKITETTYCFRRWSDWSEYTDQEATASDKLKVQTKKQYCYRSKTEAELRNPYTDVDENAGHFEAVMWASEQGIMNGTSANTFDPNGQVTRGQMVIMLWRAAGKPAPASSECPFQDVPEDSAYYDAVLWATQNGIAGGASADTFGVDTPCSRAHAITFLYRAVGEPEVTLSQEPFADVEPDQFFYKPVLWAYEKSISSGVSTTEFGVEATCSRIQVAIMLYRAFGEG